MKSLDFCIYQKHFFRVFALIFLLVSTYLPHVAQAQGAPEKRLAFVVGNAAYKAGALPTPANDAGLIAQTLQAAGFDVIGARDLDQNGLRDAMRDFLAKARDAGPSAVVFVYLAGYGLQYQGDNYFVPVDAQIANATDVPIEAVRMTDFTKSLAAMGNRGSMVVLDMARTNPFAQSSQPLAGGLSLVDPDANQLIAFNAAPGTVGPAEPGPYGSYAHALAEMIRVGGLPLDEVFDRTRLRVSDLTKGAEIPWDASKFKDAFSFFDRGPNVPAAESVRYDAAAIRAKSIRDFDEKDAYFAALDRDTLQGYEDFLAAYPNDAMARRVRAIVAARREAITWRETWSADTPSAYWSYLRRYPHGPHVWDARRRLAHLEASLEPPPSFTVIEYHVPPPPPAEIVYVDRPVLYFDNADFGYAPPAPMVFLAPPPPDFVVLVPPRPPAEVFVLPEPVFVPVPVWVEPARNFVPPQNNIIFNNIHNKIVNNTIINTATPPAGTAPTARQVLAASAVASAPHVALPPSIARTAELRQGANPVTSPKASMNGALQPMPPAGRQPGVANAPTNRPAGMSANGHALPTTPKLPENAVGGPTEKQGLAANPHALPGFQGKPLPQDTKMLSVNEHPPAGKLPTGPAVSEDKQKPAAIDAKVSAPAPKAPSVAVNARRPVVNKVATPAAPRVAVSTVRRPNPPAARPKPTPHVNAPQKLSAAQPQMPARPKPPAPKKCGAKGLPACR
ncbi:caspase family protein [Oryzifoliimicrobium ureilyticus]|uniref:caspase family protein n=1 Tax=Oryzifoliimicrobium ureilyticus TaxID=3113724 RepID=UPI0030765DF7